MDAEFIFELTTFGLEAHKMCILCLNNSNIYCILCFALLNDDNKSNNSNVFRPHCRQNCRQFHFKTILNFTSFFKILKIKLILPKSFYIAFQKQNHNCFPCTTAFYSFHSTGFQFLYPLFQFICTWFFYKAFLLKFYEDSLTDFMLQW